MSFTLGVILVLVSLLCGRGLMVWDRKYGPIGKLGDTIIANLGIPLLIGGFVLGASWSVIGLWNGLSWMEVAAAAVAVILFYLAWRFMGRLPGRPPAVPVNPKPTVTAGDAGPHRSGATKRAA